MRGLTALVVPLLAVRALVGQAASAATEIKSGDSLHTALQPAQALAHYRVALAHDSTDYEALWKAGRELIDIAKQIEGKDDAAKRARDSLYTQARAYGEVAERVRAHK